MDETLRVALETGKLDMRYYLEDPDPVLSTNCAPFEPEEFGEVTAKFGKLLAAKMLASSTGIGLAAPQVGILKRAFAMFDPSFVSKITSGGVEYPDPGKHTICVFNPMIVPLQGGDWLYNEGCLSVPNVFGQVRRPKNIVITYQNGIGEIQQMELTMLPARVALHENDHLEGRMFFDRMSRQMRRATLREWERLKSNYHAHK